MNLYQGVALGVVVIAVAWDLATRRIPNVLTFGAALTAVLVHGYFGGWSAMGLSLAGWLVGVAFFLPFFALGGMGAGDVKLMTAVGCISGVPAVFHIMLACALAGGIIALGIMLYRSSATRTVRNVWELLRFHAAHGPQVHPTLNIDNPQAIRLPYAVAIAAGSGYALLEIGRAHV